MVRSFESRIEAEATMVEKMLDVEEIDDTDIADEVDILDSGEGELSPQSGRHDWASQLVNVGHMNGIRYPDSAAVSPNGNGCLDPDRRMRRQIANCNERRRMQSINAGFQTLRNLLPRKEGEKLSKAAILQQTAELIHSLKNEMNRLLDDREGAVPKRRRFSEEIAHEETRQVIEQLQCALERERGLRALYESQLASQLPMAQPAKPQPPLGLVQEEAKMLRMHIGEETARPVPTLAPLPLLTMVGTTHNTINHALSPEATVSVIKPLPTTPVLEALPPTPTMSLTPQPPTINTSTPTIALNFGIQRPLSSLGGPTNSPSPPQLNTPPVSAAFETHRSLNVILDAIRHLEGGAYQATPPTTPTSHANLMVR
ncbi:unnamed protein product, partial [Mesorhabditis spiculigera]